MFQYSEQNNSSLVLLSGGALLIFTNLNSTLHSYSLFFYLFLSSDKYNPNLLGKYFFLIY